MESVFPDGPSNRSGPEQANGSSYHRNGSSGIVLGQNPS